MFIAIKQKNWMPFLKTIISVKKTFRILAKRLPEYLAAVGPFARLDQKYYSKNKNKIGYQNKLVVYRGGYCMLVTKLMVDWLKMGYTVP